MVQNGRLGGATSGHHGLLRPPQEAMALQAQATQVAFCAASDLPMFAASDLPMQVARLTERSLKSHDEWKSTARRRQKQLSARARQLKEASFALSRPHTDSPSQHP